MTFKKFGMGFKIFLSFLMIWSMIVIVPATYSEGLDEPEVTELDTYTDYLTETEEALEAEQVDEIEIPEFYDAESDMEEVEPLVEIEELPPEAVDSNLSSDAAYEEETDAPFELLGTEIEPLSDEPIAIENWADLRAAVNATTGTTVATPRVITITGSFDTASGMPSNTAAIAIPVDQHIRLVSSGTSNFSLTQNNTSGQRHFILGNNSSLTIERVTLTRGTVGDVATTYGGGIFLSGTSSRLTLNTGAIVENARAAIVGGGIYVTGIGTPEVIINQGAVIRNNHAGQNGGGISLGWASSPVASRTLTINGGQISSNRVPGNSGSHGGGGIYATGGSVIHLSGAIIGGDIAADANHAHQGAGIMVVGLVTVNMSNHPTLGRTRIVRNMAQVAGGAMLFTGDQGTHGTGHPIFNMQDGEIAHNQILQSGGMGGGGIRAFGTNTLINMYHGAIHNNHAAGNGGGVSIGGGTIFSMHNGRIHHNTANVMATGEGGGGVRVAAGGIFNMYDGAIDNNEATNGAGVSVVYVFNLHNGVVHHNRATENGGGIWSGGSNANPSAFAMMGGRIRNNTAVNGAGYFQLSGHNHLIGGTIGGTAAQGNQATGDGGGVYIAAGTFNFGGTTPTVSGNHANNGGGIYMAGGTFDFGSSGERNVRGNTATTNGGGIYRGANGTFISGSGIRNVVGNTAGDSGGGIHWVTGDITFNSDLNISDNTAIHNGGGINIVAGHVTLSDTQVHNNRAATGTGVSNTITGYGGGVKVANLPASLTINGGDFSGNHAGREGGAIWTGAHDYTPVLPEEAYDNLITDDHVIFSENSAGLGSYEPPFNWDNTQIRGTGASPTIKAHQVHQLNNFDVNFRGERLDFEFIKTDARINDLAFPIANVARLSGATFTLEREIAPNIWGNISTATSGPNGVVLFERTVTPYIRYRLTETVAPTGFIRPAGHWYVQLDASGEMVTTYPQVYGSQTLAFRYRENQWFVGNTRKTEPPSIDDDSNGSNGGGPSMVPDNDQGSTTEPDDVDRSLNDPPVVRDDTSSPATTVPNHVDRSTLTPEPSICEAGIIVNVSEDGSVVVITPAGIDYEVTTDEAGTIMVRIPPEADDCDVIVNLPSDEWAYDVRDGGSIIIIRPPVILTRPEDEDGCFLVRVTHGTGRNGIATQQVQRSGNQSILMTQKGIIAGSSLFTGILFVSIALMLLFKKQNT